MVLRKSDDLDLGEGKDHPASAGEEFCHNLQDASLKCQGNTRK
jgi:hypothetical protein